MSQQNSGIRRTQSITDAVYGRPSRKAPKQEPKRTVNPRRDFSIASRLDPETLGKLEALASEQPAKPKRRRRRRAVK